MDGGASEPQQAPKVPKKDRHIFTVGSSVDVLAEEQDYGGVFYAATVLESTPSTLRSGKTYLKNKLYVEYHNLVVEEGRSEHLREYVDVSLVRPEPPASQERVGVFFEVGELVDAFYNNGWWTGVVTQLVEGGDDRPRVIVTFSHASDVREFGATELRPHMKWVDGAWITPEKQDVPVLSYIDGVHLHDQGLKISESRALNLMNNQSEESTPVNQKTSQVANSVTERRHSPEPQAFSLPLKRLKEGGFFGARQQGGRSLETGSMKLRRKGKPRKYSPMNRNSQNGDPNPKSTNEDGVPRSVSEKVVIVIDEVLADQEKMSLDGDKFAKDHSGPGYNIQVVTERSLVETHDANSDEETPIASLRRQILSKSQKISRQVHDHPKASGENKNTKNYDGAVDPLVTGAPGLKIRDGPLSKCTNEMSSIGSSNLGIPKDKFTENDEAQIHDELSKEDKLKNNQQASALTNGASFEPSDEPALPFVKTNDLWKTIESLEAFKKIPQKPHFRPLENFPERSRQGLAIGLMVTCSSVMEEALNLRLSHPKTIADSILEILAELETHGFDLRVVKDHVNNFIAVKDKQHKDLEEENRLTNQILECEGERRRNGKEVDEIRKEIQKLQEKLMLFESADAKADEKISNLKAKLRETEKDIKNAGRDFEAASSW